MMDRFDHRAFIGSLILGLAAFCALEGHSIACAMCVTFAGAYLLKGN